MSRLLIKLKKSLICFMALATSASMLAPVSVYATETTSEVNVDNHTQGRDNAKTVSGITIGDVDAPKEGVRLDDTAVVTTAEGETWEIPVIWIGEDLKPDTGLAGKGSYLPVLAYVVPEEYTIRNDDARDRGYKITLSEDLLKLFGEEKIISVYENKTRITYIIPAKLKDLFAQKGTVKNPTDAGGNEYVSEDQVAPFKDDAEEEPAQEQEKEPEQEPEEKPEQEQKEEPAKEQEEEPAPEQEEDEEEEESYSRIVNVHCDANAKEALTADDLEFLANLVVNILEPQAVNLLIERFPAFKKAAENKEIGGWITVVVSYQEGSDTYGYATPGRTTDNTYPDNKFVYRLTVNAAPLTDHKENGEAVVNRDVNSDSIKTLANTVVHELFHCISFDYNRPGLTGMLYTSDGLKDYLEDPEVKVLYPYWFIEGTASTVENNWQFRQDSFKLLRTPVNGDPDPEGYSHDLLVKRYVDGRIHKNENGELVCDNNFDIEFCNGKDKNGRDCDNIDSHYVGGYLACLYLYELAAKSDSEIGTSVSTDGGNTEISSEKLRLGMDSILKRMHNGETLDQVINSISGGAYKDTADFEARFIKGPKDETDGKYSLDGDAESVSFVCDFMNYMNRIDQAKADGQRTNYANGSVLFDFEEDFVSPLSFEGTYTAPVLQPLDDEDGEFQEFARSTVKDSFAYSTGGQSLSGKSAGASGTNASNNTLTSVTPAQESSALPEAAKEITEAAVGSTTEVLIESGAAYATDEGTVSESSSDEGADETASEIAAEGSSVEAATQADTAPAPEASSEVATEATSETEAETAESADTAAATSSEGESASDNASESASESASEEEPEAAPAGETTQE